MVHSVNSKKSVTTLLFSTSTSIIDKVLVSFVNSNIEQSNVVGQQLFHLLPDIDGNVLCRCDHANLFEKLNVSIQSLVVHWIGDLDQDFLQVPQVHGEAQMWFDVSKNGGLNLVVVAVAADVIALPEVGLVLLVAHCRVVEPVGGAKGFDMGQIGYRHSSSFDDFLIN